jgi:hypothetical protein
MVAHRRDSVLSGRDVDRRDSSSPLKYVAKGCRVEYDDRIFAFCTRHEDARKIALALNGGPKKKVKKR